MSEVVKWCLQLLSQEVRKKYSLHDEQLTFFSKLKTTERKIVDSYWTTTNQIIYLVHMFCDDKTLVVSNRPMLCQRDTYG